MRILPATPADLGLIVAAARLDGHIALGSTHFLKDENGSIKGAFSAGGVTTILFWSHTGNSRFASLRAVEAAKKAARAHGKPVLCLCTDDSPFTPMMPDFGFTKLGSANVWELK